MGASVHRLDYPLHREALLGSVLRVMCHLSLNLDRRKGRLQFMRGIAGKGPLTIKRRARSTLRFHTAGFLMPAAEAELMLVQEERPVELHKDPNHAQQCQL